MTMGKKTIVAQNRTFRVIWLELESQIVRLLLGWLLEGNRNGYIEIPAVKMTPATVILLEIKPRPGKLILENSRVNSVVIITMTGILSNQGKTE